MMPFENSSSGHLLCPTSPCSQPQHLEQQYHCHYQAYSVISYPMGLQSLITWHCIAIPSSLVVMPSRPTCPHVPLESMKSGTQSDDNPVSNIDMTTERQTVQEPTTKHAKFKNPSTLMKLRSGSPRRLWCHIYLKMKSPGFDLVPMLIGRGGCNMYRIFKATNTKIRIRGQGSGHLERPKRQEAPTPLMVAVTADRNCNCTDFRTAVEMLLVELRRVAQQFVQEGRWHGEELFCIGELSKACSECLGDILNLISFLGTESQSNPEPYKKERFTEETACRNSVFAKSAFTQTKSALKTAPTRTHLRSGSPYRLWCHIHLMMISPGFDLVPMIIGREGCNMRRISETTNAKIRIRGKGSGYFEGRERKEAPTPLMVAVTTDRNRDFNEFRTAVYMLLKELKRVAQRFVREGRKHCKKLFFIKELSKASSVCLGDMLDLVDIMGDAAFYRHDECSEATEPSLLEQPRVR